MLVRSRKERVMRGGAAPSPPCMGAPPHAPGDFLAKRKSPKIRQGPPGPWTPSEGGLAPFDPPAFSPSGIGCDNLNLQASSKPTLPRHGLTAGSVTPGVAWGKKKTDLPTYSKWQIGLFLRLKPYRGGAGTAGGAKRPPRGIPKGGSPWRAFGDFPRDGKVTRGRRGGAPSPRGRGGPSPHFGERRGCPGGAAPRKKGFKGKFPLNPHQPFEQGLIEPGGVLLNPLFGLQALL